MTRRWQWEDDNDGGEDREFRRSEAARRRDRLQCGAGMPLLGKIFEPAIEKAGHAHAMLEDRLGRRERPERVPKTLAGMAMGRLCHVRIAIDAQPSRRRWAAGIKI